MSSTTVAEFASELKKSTETLLDQLKSAGVSKASPSDVLTDADKHSLLNFLQSSHGTAGADRKITLEYKLPDFVISGPTGLLDADGGALVIHEKADDYKTDPSGNSGKRIICGVFKSGNGS